jgi:hypothetical protein
MINMNFDKHQFSIVKRGNFYNAWGIYGMESYEIEIDTLALDAKLQEGNLNHTDMIMVVSHLLKNINKKVFNGFEELGVL